MGINALKKLKEKIHSSETYWFESAKLEFVKALNQRVRRLGMKNKDLANHIDSSPAYISKVMRGDENLTIESMVKLARATGGHIHFHITEVDERVAWFGVARKKKAAGKPGKSESVFKNLVFDMDDTYQWLQTNGKGEELNAA
ncbi:Helix-turn-helix [Marinobacter sp. LV10R510-11A]|uniref:helix-turn-helix domain-containing protein n=1 Tax=Marinobacter sp. LV10R510-11A TaxID=1415568 RepID=UPI000BB6BEC5|nr:helix-turn-helix transcriptional regulator [Marinobacter sp. LV10R510-11A]SOB76149.1 Helix-turn-helix [Marinobacter sp. LV10R510-11A]